MIIRLSSHIGAIVATAVQAPAPAHNRAAEGGAWSNVATYTKQATQPTTAPPEGVTPEVAAQPTTELPEVVAPEATTPPTNALAASSPNKMILGAIAGGLAAALSSKSSSTSTTTSTAASGTLYYTEYTAQYGLASINALSLNDSGYTGSGVKLAIVDTGINSSHSEFAGRTISGYDFSTGTGGYSSDVDGHGTHVASIAAGNRDAVGMRGVAYDAMMCVR